VTLDSRVVLRAALFVAGPASVFAVLVGRVAIPLSVAIAIALGVILSVAAARSPRVAVLVAVALVAIVPYYDGRLVTRAVGLTPMGACCLVLFPAAWAARGHVTLLPLDFAVAALVLLRCLALLLNFSHGFGAIFTVALQVALPYVVFRCLLTERDLLAPLASVVVGSAALLALIGISEHDGTPNPFFTWIRPQYQAAQWARAETRDRSVRAEASFGHPIAFGMFLAVALVLSVALALVVRRLWLTVLLLGTAALIVLALADTLSRGPLLVAALGVGSWLLLTSGRVSIFRLGAVAALFAVLLMGTPVLGIVQRLVNDTTASDTRVGASTQYRLEILAVATDPAQFTLLGTQNETGGVTEAVFERTGLVSIDSEFALVYLTSGALSLAALVVVVLMVLRLVPRPGLSPLERAWAVAMAASALNLLTVALLTQQAELFWAWVALLAGIVQRHRTHGLALPAAAEGVPA
jgi:hypothetical protein